MKIFKTLLLGAALLCTAVVMANDKKNFDVDSFNGISSTDGFLVNVTMGDVESVEVEAPSEVMGRVQAITENGILKLSFKGSNVNLIGKRVVVNVTAKELNSLRASAGSRLEVSGQVASDNVSLEASSGAVVKTSVKADNLSMHSSSGGEIQAGGVVNGIEAKASSGAMIYATEMTAESASVEASSGAVIHISAKAFDSVKVTSGARVRYEEEAAVKNVSVSSGGSFRKK